MRFLIISTICISIFYFAYRILLRKETNFKHLRLFLLASMVISVALPLSNFSIDINLNTANNENPIVETLNQEATPKALLLKENEQLKQVSRFKSVNWFLVLSKIYRVVALLLIFRLIIQVLYLFYKFFKSERIIKGSNIYLYKHGFKNSFSFFNWIFIDNEKSSEEDLQNIIAHEEIHVKQYHSIDLLFIELLLAVMWFNPFVWMMRNSIQLVHEYLADEGVLKSGVNKINYQALLVNLVSEEKLISISSSFNKSLIKKRMIMMNKSKIGKRFSLKVLAILPVAIFLFAGVACVNGQESGNKTTELIETKQTEQIKVEEPKSSVETTAAVELSKMNVVYVGVENPVKIAVSGYAGSELVPYITNAYIKKVGNNDYVINPRRPGPVRMTIKANGVNVETKEFRAKRLPNPIVQVAGKSGGDVKRKELLAQVKVDVIMPNLDFDLEFKVVSFSVSTTDDDGYYIEARSGSNKFTNDQKEIIWKAAGGSRINFENILVIGLDGITRELAPIVFEIIE